MVAEATALRRAPCGGQAPPKPPKILHAGGKAMRGAQSMTPLVGLGAVVVMDGNILLILRGRPPYEGLWSLPGGKLNMGETIEEALRREVAEETGLSIEVGNLAGVVESIDPEGRFHYVILDYFATVSGGQLEAGDDASDARWVSLQDLAELNSTPNLLYYLHRFGVNETRS